MLKKFNTTETWIDVETLANLKGISKRAIRLSFNSKNSNYETKIENGKGGHLYKIRLSSIEEELQIKYIHEYYDTLATTNNIVELHEFKPKAEKIISFKQRELALAKYDLIKIWENYRLEQKQKGISKKVADSEFLTTYNTGLLYSKIFNVLGSVSIGALYRWKMLLDKNPDWTVLVGNYNYTANGCYRTSLNENEIKIFLNILLSPNKFSIGRAISLTQYILKEKNAENIPTEVTFRRYAKWYKANNLDKWTLARDGMKALKDKVEPYIVRDVIMLEENTQNIANALRNAILNMDKVPEYVYQDNGRAFKSKFFNGDSKFEELGFTGVYQKLGITPVYATPYNARAKVIERFFLDFQESFEKLMPSYIGTSIENKPAYMNRNEKLHKQIHSQKANFVPTIEQALILIKEWLKFKHSQPCPNNRNKTIAQMLATIQKQNIDESQLDDLMMDTVVKHIGRNGIRFLKADYFNDALYGIRGKCVVKYSLNDLSYIKIYSMKGEFLCRADRVTATHPLAHLLGDVKDIEDYKQKIRKQKQLQNKTIKAVKEHFSLEDIDLIKSKLIDAEISKEELIIEQPAIEKQEVKKEKTKQPENYVQNRKRPIFKDNYERYEWHMKNGCIGNEDRQWLSEYIRSEEFKIIYEK